MVVIPFSELDTHHRATQCELDAGLPGSTDQSVLESSPVDLKARNGEEMTRAALEPLGDVGVITAASQINEISPGSQARWKSMISEYESAMRLCVALKEL